MNQTKKNHSVFQNIIHLMGMAYRHHKIVFIFILLEIVCNGVLPLFGLYLPKLAVDLAINGGSFGHVLSVLGAFVSAYVALQCINSVASQGKYPFQNNMRFVYSRALFEKALDCDYDLMETNEGQTCYEKAKSALTNGDGSAPSQMFFSITGLVSGLISFLFISGIISGLSPSILVLLIVLSAFNYFLDSFALKYETSKRGENADLQKKTYYIKSAMADTGAAKDVRLYHLTSLFTDRKKQILSSSFDLTRRIKNRYFLSSSLKLLTTVCRDGIAYAYCIGQVMNGSITVSDFILYMSAIASFSAWLNGIVSNILILRRENTRLNDLRAFYDYTNRLDPDNPLPLSELAAPFSIEFKNVGFQYEGAGRKVLDGLSFQIRPNEKIALVGMNGAGKTTIVKLLCGFYQATEGEILINGRNINAFRRADLYTLYSAVFQDICILPVTAGENIAFKKASEWEEGRLLQCLETAGIKNEILKEPKGLNAPMLKSIEPDGIMLSGGQQQKFLLARALYKDAPILILDEPTAALDPIAESEVYDGFHEVTQNKTAVYISHRLASTRFCDRILMLKDGKIIENGSHDELMARNGEYAYMYEIQSHYYKQEGGAV